MTRKLPRPLGSLRNPPSPPPPSPLPPVSFHFLPLPATTPRPAAETNSLFVYQPTHFPSIRHASFFPTLRVHMPSSSSIDRLPTKCPDLVFFPSPNSSNFPLTPPNSPTKAVHFISRPQKRQLLTARLGRSSLILGRLSWKGHGPRFSVLQAPSSLTC